MINTTIASFSVGSPFATAQTLVWEYDQTQYLQIEGLELPYSCSVDFCNVGDSSTITMPCVQGKAEIPDDFFETGKNIKAYVVLTDDLSVQTRYEIVIPVIKRPTRTDIQPTPAEQQQIDALLQALSDGVDAADAAADEAEASAIAALASEQAARASANEADQAASSATASANNASSSANDAEQAATEAALSESNAAASEQNAAESAAEAKASEESAQAYAQTATAKASEAAGSAATATSKASEASASATSASGSAATATQKAADASSSASDASTSATNASTSATAAATSATNAANAQTAAETAQGKAEDAQAVAENAAQSVSESAAQIATNKEDIADLKSAIGHVVEAEISPNIYNPETDTNGVQLANAGYTFANADYSTSDFIDISGVSNPYMAAEVDLGNQVLRICYYDAQKANIANTTQGASVGTGGTVANNTLFALNVPQGAVYIRFHYFTAHVSRIYVGVEFSPYEYAPYGTEVIVLPSNETIEARGSFDTLDDRLNDFDSRIPENNKIVEYWGDSLTQGNQDGSGVSRKSIMSTLLGETWTVNNYGVGGEPSNAIAARASGIYGIITPGVTIPADGSTVDLTGHLKDIYGNDIAWGSGIYSSAYSSWITVNPCKVDGVDCILQRANASSPITIKRQAPGTAIVVTRPTYIVMNSETFEKNPVLLICIGQNEGFNRDADELISQIDGIIDARKADRYIVFGMSHALYGYTWQASINEKLKMHYGKHYYDIEAYMKTPVYSGDTIVSSYALQDAEITPTASDLTAIGNNQYPPSIMFDAIHFNQYGYKVWANREYLIGNWLGYWE